jgi:hypothetical protein
MPKLYPTFAPLDLTEAEQSPEFKKSIYFDFNKGDFVTDGTGKLQAADEYNAWIQWCLKAVYTERYAYLAYSDEYGAELEEIMRGNENKSAKESSIARTITDTLMADPAKRTISVANFNFDWKNDSIYVSFEVVAANIGKATLTVQYS